jgi:8-oxo-dGTP diphosphatase
MKFNELYNLINEEVESSTACATIISKGDKILLLKRGSTAPWMPNKWNLAGGMLDEGENLEECARREALEETGLTLGKLMKLAPIPQSWGTLYLFHTEQMRGTLRLSWENTEFGWFSLDEAIEMDLVPPLREVFQKMNK